MDTDAGVGAPKPNVPTAVVFLGTTFFFELVCVDLMRRLCWTMCERTWTIRTDMVITFSHTMYTHSYNYLITHTVSCPHMFFFLLCVHTSNCRCFESQRNHRICFLWFDNFIDFVFVNLMGRVFWLMCGRTWTIRTDMVIMFSHTLSTHYSHYAQTVGNQEIEPLRFIGTDTQSVRATQWQGQRVSGQWWRQWERHTGTESESEMMRMRRRERQFEKEIETVRERETQRQSDSQWQGEWGM